SVGYNPHDADFVVTEACNPAWVDRRTGIDIPGTASPRTWLDYRLFPEFFASSPVSQTQVTRYGIDLELAPSGTLWALLFDSIRRTISPPNKARLTVWYRVGGGGTCRPPCEVGLVTPAEGPMGRPASTNGPFTVAFTLERASFVSLSIYDVAGRTVRRLHCGALPAGSHTIEWDGRDGQGRTVANGIYITRLEADDRVTTHKVVLAR